MPRLLCMAASYREESANKRLLAIAASHAHALGATSTTIDYRDVESPNLRDDGEMGALPEGAARFVQALEQSDGVIFAVPEYNWSIPGAFKNLIDWVSIAPSLPLHGKTALLLCASPSVRGGISGLLQLRVPLEHLNMWVYPQVVGVGRAHEVVGADALFEAKEEAFLKACVEDFVIKTRAMVTNAT